MGSLKHNDPFQSFQLLPPAYRNHRRATRAVCTWIAVACTLLAILGGLIGATALEAKRDYQARQQLIAAALPLLDLRRDVLGLGLSNQRRQQWCDWVESAQPDGNAFQTLATIATTCPSGDLKIDRILVKLPREYPATDQAPPAWAAAQLNITAREGSPGAAAEWIERLNGSDRVADADIDDAPLDLSGGRVEITATPITTRVLP